MSVGTAILSSVCVGTIAVIAVIKGRGPNAKQREERRRRRLATVGRIIDGSIVDVEPMDSTPRVIMYTYRIAGVSYECSQDVSDLSELVENLRLDRPVQVRYSRDNPADSIVVSETWNGLRRTGDGVSGQFKVVQTNSGQFKVVQTTSGQFKTAQGRQI